MSTLNAFFQPKDVPLVLGHRGVPKLHQENSLSSFRKAVELGIDGVEFDVFKTKDDQLVVFHDEETERLTGVKNAECSSGLIPCIQKTPVSPDQPRKVKKKYSNAW